MPANGRSTDPNPRKASVLKARNLIGLPGAALLLASCIPSVTPLYTARDVVRDPRLPGVWQEAGGKEQPDTWKFAPSNDGAYQLTVTEKKGKQGKLAAHLFKLKSEYFLDLVPTDCNHATNQADLVAFAMFPGHLLFQVPELGPELRVAPVNFDWLQKYLEQHPRALAHHREGDRLLLTARTRDLQHFVLRHLGQGELFEQPDILIRETNDPSATTPAIPQ